MPHACSSILWRIGGPISTSSGASTRGSAAILAVRDALAVLGAVAAPVSLADVQAHASAVAKAKVRSVLAMMKLRNGYVNSQVPTPNPQGG
jgi:hypothetical protein